MRRFVTVVCRCRRASVLCNGPFVDYRGFAGSYYSRRITDGSRVRRNVLDDYSAGADDGVIANVNIFHDADMGGDVYIVSNGCRGVPVCSNGEKLTYVAIVSDDGAGVDDDSDTVSDV